MISEKDVRHIGSLARIHLTDDEIAPLSQNLGNILDYIAKLQTLNLDSVEPTSHVLALKDVFREDSPNASLPRDEALAIAPDAHNGFYKVPKVIE